MTSNYFLLNFLHQLIFQNREKTREPLSRLLNQIRIRPVTPLIDKTAVLWQGPFHYVDPFPVTKPTVLSITYIPVLIKLSTLINPNNLITQINPNLTLISQLTRPRLENFHKIKFACANQHTAHMHIQHS